MKSLTRENTVMNDHQDDPGVAGGTATIGAAVIVVAAIVGVACVYLSLLL